jgi:hypothetical protein
MVLQPFADPHPLAWQSELVHLRRAAPPISRVRSFPAAGAPAQGLQPPLATRFSSLSAWVFCDTAAALPGCSHLASHRRQLGSQLRQVGTTKQLRQALPKVVKRNPTRQLTSVQVKRRGRSRACATGADSLRSSRFRAVSCSGVTAVLSARIGIWKSESESDGAWPVS